MRYIIEFSDFKRTTTFPVVVDSEDITDTTDWKDFVKRGLRWVDEHASS